MKLLQVAHRVAVGLLLSHLAACMRPPAPESPADLVVSLRTSKSAYSAEEAIEVVFTLENRSDQDLRVLTRHTPFEGFRSAMFVVRRRGEILPYRGALVKRSVPTRKSPFLHIKAGESIERSLDLADVYTFSKRGKYQLWLETGIYYRQEPSRRRPIRSLQPAKLVTAAVDFELTEEREVYRSEKANVVLAAPRGDGFGSCKPNRREKLIKVLESAAQLADETKAAADQGFRTDRSRLWFGTQDEDSWEGVAEIFGKLVGTLEDGRFTFDCWDKSQNGNETRACGECKEDAIAYVLPENHFEVCICKRFWASPIGKPYQLDSQEGTLVHEFTHFREVAGLEDKHLTGACSCQARAKAGSQLTLAAPDCYQYFAENPSLSCGT